MNALTSFCDKNAMCQRREMCGAPIHDDDQKRKKIYEPKMAAVREISEDNTQFQQNP